MKKRTIVAGIALLLLAGGRLPAQEATGDPAARIEAIKAEYQQARTDFYQKYREATTDEERQETAKTSPSADRYGDELLAIARAADGGDVGMDALLWILQNIRTPDTQERALAIALDHYVGHQNAGGLCGSLLYSTAPSTLKILEQIIEVSEHNEARGIACYTLAQRLKSEAETASMLRASGPESEERIGITSYLGEEKATELLATDPAKLEAKAEKIFERVVADFGDVSYRRGTLAAAARGDLNELRNLAIGKMAPEIQGEDIDGVAFKLSDYRGKVVVLDFWGNW